MTFWEKLFGKKKKVTDTPAAPVPQPHSFDTMVATQTLQEDDDNRPVQRKMMRGTYRPTVIKNFMDQDWWTKGYNDALQFPVQERRQWAQHNIRTSFIQALQQAAMQLSAELKSHEQQALQLAGVSQVLDQQMQLRTEEIKALMALVDQQLALCVDGEGWIATVFAAYNEGFSVGALQYAKINDLLGGLTTLK